MQRGFFNITEIRARFKSNYSVTITANLEAKTLDDVQTLIRQQLQFYIDRYNAADDEIEFIADVKYVY